MQDHALETLNLFAIVPPLVGVVIGGALTFGYQLLFRYFDRKRVRKERMRRVHQTTGAIMRSLSHLRNALEERIPTELPDVRSNEWWTLLTPMYGFDLRPIDYSIDDMSVIAAPKFQEMTEELRNWCDKRNVVVALIPTFNQLRKELSQALTPYYAKQGETLLVDLRYREDKALMHLESEVNAMAMAIAKSILSLWRESIEFTPRYNVFLKELLGKKTTAAIDLQDNRERRFKDDASESQLSTN